MVGRRCKGGSQRSRRYSVSRHTERGFALIELFGLALDQYRLDNDFYPGTTQGLAALRERPSGEPQARNWRGPYVRKAISLDPWGRPYAYKSPGNVNAESYDLLSLGRDGQPGGSGEDADVTSWESSARRQ